MDIRKDSLNIDLQDAANKIGEFTKLLTFPIWGGNPDEMFWLELFGTFAEAYWNRFGKECPVLLDCAHWFPNYMLDNDGDYPLFYTFSFQAIKHLTTGDGGCLVCPDEESYIMARKLRWFGLDRDKKEDFRSEQNIQMAGYKYHMNDIAATIGLANLPHIEHNVRKQIDFIDDIPETKHYSKYFYLSPREAIGFPGASGWLCTLKCKDSKHLQKYLLKHNIESNPVHHRNDRHRCVGAYYNPDSVPNLNEIEGKYINIPCHWGLSYDEQKHIINTLENYDENLQV